MRLTKKIILSITLYVVLSLAIFLGISFAEPGIKITTPPNDSTVNPGQEITVTIESVDGFVVQEGIANIAGSEHNERITSLPWSFTDKIPLKAIGEAYVSVLSRDASGNIAVDDITLKVAQTASLISFDFGDYTHFYFTTDWDGNPKAEDKDYIRVKGVYSDGITRKIPREDLNFASSDSSIVSVDSQGNIKPNKLGEVTITVSKGNISGTAKVSVKKPTGIRPLETIPPTIQINIQPSANQADWHNSYLTIILTAQDNEGGSGIREIDYSILGTRDMQDKYVESAEANIFFDKEGSYELVYAAIDKEGNYGQTNRHKLNLDKTPSEVIITTPENKAEYLLNGQVIASWSATDLLSGVKSATGTTASGSAINTATAGTKTFSVVAVDNADNKTEAQHTYYVRYLYSGVLPPINQDGSSIFKLGRVIPVKFQLKDNVGNYISTAVAKIYLSKVSDNVAGTEIEAESPGEANTGNLFRYDTTDNQYIFNLGTKNLSNGTWQIKISLDDVSSKYVTISLK
ncbi:MAG: PxKF domain-containing protein [Candidatus Omnitrophota bacterium]